MKLQRLLHQGMILPFCLLLQQPCCCHLRHLEVSMLFRSRHVCSLGMYTTCRLGWKRSTSRSLIIIEANALPLCFQVPILGCWHTLVSGCSMHLQAPCPSQRCVALCRKSKDSFLDLRDAAPGASLCGIHNKSPVPEYSLQVSKFLTAARHLE